MRLLLIGAALAAVSVVAGCSNAGSQARQQIVASCMASDGASQEMCDCMANGLDEALDDRQLAAVAKGMSGETLTPEEEALMSNDPAAAQQATMAMFTCASMGLQMKG